MAIIVAKAKLLKGNVDAINVTDNQTAIVRMSSIAVSAPLKQMGLEPTMQMVCRDRNRIAMQSDIFGAVCLRDPEHPLPLRRPSEIREPPDRQERL